MSQHDYILANQTGAAFRGDLNDALAAIVTNNSGAAEPTTTYKFQWWADETNDLLKIRNAANSAWITVGTLSSARLGLAIAGLATGSGLTVSGAGKVLGRTTSGAGAVEELTIGTAASNLVQLTAAAKLPAVDGSLLTGIMDSVSRDQIALTNLRLMLNSAITTGALVQGKQWELSTDEWGATSTNETYTAGSPNYYGNPGGYTANISTSGNSISGGDDVSYPKGNAFDGDTGTWWYASQTGAGVNGVSYIGSNFGSAKSISRVRISQRSTYGLSSVLIQHSDNGSSWTTATTASVTSAGGVWDVIDFSGAGAHQYWRILANSAPVNTYWIMGEVEMMESITPSNMTLIPDASVSISSVPSYMDAYFLWKDDSGSAVLGTDLTVELSRDNGTTYTTATITNLASYDGTYSILRARADVSGQPSGTSMLCRIKTLNNKAQRVAAPALYAE